jgi:threonine synthase
LATNENDILYRFVRFGEYAKNQVKKTLSPSMDIQVASNFERYLYYLYDQNCNTVKALMQKFDKDGKLVFNDKILQIQNDFSAYRVSDEEILHTIKDFYEKYNYIMDPHTACGVKAAIDGAIPSVCLATAHPAKFAQAIEKALGFSSQMPENLAKLSIKKRKFEEDNSVEAIKHFMKKHAIL